MASTLSRALVSGGEPQPPGAGVTTEVSAPLVDVDSATVEVETAPGTAAAAASGAAVDEASVVAVDPAPVVPVVAIKPAASAATVDSGVLDCPA